MVGKKHAILDGASDKTFLKEKVAGVLGLQEPLQKVLMIQLKPFSPCS